MADKAFDRNLIVVRERPLSSDVNALASALHRGQLTLASQLLAYFHQNHHDPLSMLRNMGFIGQGFQPWVDTFGDGFFKLKAGFGLQINATTHASIGGALRASDVGIWKLLATDGITISGMPAADTLDTRVDLLEVRYNIATLDPSSRDVLDPITGAFLPGLVDKTASYFTEAAGAMTVNGAGALNLKTGVLAPNPVAPAVSSGYMPIAQILRPAGSGTTITEDLVCDVRDMLALQGAQHFAFTLVLTGGNAAPLTFTVQDAVVPPGMDWTLYTREPSSGLYQGRDIIGVRLSGPGVGRDLAGSAVRSRASAHAELYQPLGFQAHPNNAEPIMLVHCGHDEATLRIGAPLVSGTGYATSTSPIGTYVADQIVAAYPLTGSQVTFGDRTCATILEWTPLKWDSIGGSWDMKPSLTGCKLHISGVIKMPFAHASL